MAKGSTFGTMVLNTTENGVKIKLADKESTSGPMEGDTKATGKTIICMEMVSTPGKTAGAMKVNTLTIENTALVRIHGLTAGSTSDSGRMESNTAKESTDRPQVKREEAFGKKAKGSNGWILVIELRTHSPQTCYLLIYKSVI